MPKKKMDDSAIPEILAPAGNRSSFLAALAAGADAIYCGLKQHSARMAATNFRMGELSDLRAAAAERGVRVYVAFNTMVKPGELTDVGRMLDRLQQEVVPDALIVQDLAIVTLARQIGFTGEIHLSTLSNVSFCAPLHRLSQNPGVQRVVLPRELSIDEIQTMARACPDTLGLEVFVHGALCYAVSGRCYWSSYLGGKSGLRGRCVQPCRRRYAQSGLRGRFFSCQDLSVDVLAKVLRRVDRIRAWKIEGRKKGPHYVFHTVQAYRLLRDQGNDARTKKEANALLSQALGRRSTHYNFLPQRPQNPVPEDGETGSGLPVGVLKGKGNQPALTPNRALFPGDTLRLGYEDEPGHRIYRVSKSVPKGGRLVLSGPPPKRAARRTPVFLIDRREKWLQEAMASVEPSGASSGRSSGSKSLFTVRLPRHQRRKSPPIGDVHIFRAPDRKRTGGSVGVWVSPDRAQPFSKQDVSHTWWCLPPVIWPEDEDRVAASVLKVLNAGGRRFILNAPWQTAVFGKRRGVMLWAGPFCNVSNPLAVDQMASLGFSGVIPSPELGAADYLALARQSPLPLGILIYGNWPLCLSRARSPLIREDRPFISPRGEDAWVARYDTTNWVYPNWRVDLRKTKPQLQRAGYSLFLHLHEPVPKRVRLKRRPGKWNWTIGLR
ncbi:Peptidase, U32 family [Olavius algarvensis associated proteobacterium Delta 3]|nr:Peptidase, U32 family [Olavius algarvensis associated proteobacterium Delta 3]